MSKTSWLDDPADIHAEIGSDVWARGVARHIKVQAEQFDSDVEELQSWIEIAAKHEAWRVLGYMTLDAFLIAEANFTPVIIEAVRKAKSGTVADAIAQAKANKDSKQGQRKTSLKLKEVQPNSNDATLRRLARDGHDELLDQIEAGEISVNKAAIQVGYRKKPSPEELAVKHFRKAENKLQVLKLIVESLDEDERSKVRVLLKVLTQ